MEKSVLTAFNRTKQPGKFREPGFIAGVIYGDSVVEGISVKFDASAVKKVLMVHGSNAKVWINYDNEKKFGFIKEIQRHPVSSIINHIDIQLVSKDHEIKLQIPILFKGEDSLKTRQLGLHIHKSDIDVFGKMDLMPDSLDIDISEKELGDTITLNDFNLDKQIKVSDKEGQIYGVIAELKVLPNENELEIVAETI